MQSFFLNRPIRRRYITNACHWSIFIENFAKKITLPIALYPSSKISAPAQLSGWSPFVGDRVKTGKHNPLHQPLTQPQGVHRSHHGAGAQAAHGADPGYGTAQQGTHQRAQAKQHLGPKHIRQPQAETFEFESWSRVWSTIADLASDRLVVYTLVQPTRSQLAC